MVQRDYEELDGHHEAAVDGVQHQHILAEVSLHSAQEPVAAVGEADHEGTELRKGLQAFAEVDYCVA